MCLEKLDIGKTRKLQRSNKPIVVWKLLKSNYTSQFKNFQWKKGLNISNRTFTELTEEEIKTNRVHLGFHFFVEKPKECLYQCLCPCPYPYRCPCPYRYRYQCLNLYQCKLKKEDPVNILAKFKIDPKDIVAVGYWEDKESIVVTKATLNCVYQK